MEQSTNEPPISFLERHPNAMAVVIGVGSAMFMFGLIILVVISSDW